MKLVLFIFVLSFNSFAGIFPTKIERLSKKFFVKKLDVQTKVVIDSQTIKEKNLCVKEQLELWIKEYKDMDSNLQGEVKSYFSHLDQVTINRPILSGQLSNTVYELRYERCYMSSMGDLAGMGTPFRDCDVYLKRIGRDPEVMNGNRPVTQASILNMKLDLTMQYMNQDIKTVVMSTRSAKVYNEVQTMDSEVYKNYVNIGKIKKWGDYTRVIPRCDFKTLRFLINMH